MLSVGVRLMSEGLIHKLRFAKAQRSIPIVRALNLSRNILIMSSLESTLLAC